MWQTHYQARAAQAEASLVELAGVEFDGSTELTIYQEFQVTENELRAMIGLAPIRGECMNDGKPILVMAFQGEDYCSESCRKELHEQAAG